MQKFTLQGELVSQIKGESNYAPWHCYRWEQYFVCEHSDHFVSMFDTNGKFLRKFGKCGSGDAEFNYGHMG